MKQFLYHLLRFSLFGVVLIFVFETLISVKPISNADIKLRESILAFEKNAKNINTLFLGDSRVFYGIDPSSINSNSIIHNFSFSSEPIATTYYKIKYYIEKDMLPKLDKILIIFDDYMLTSDTRTIMNTDYNYSKYYRHYFDEIVSEMTFLEQVSFGIKQYSNFVRLFPMLKNILELNITNIIYRPHTVSNKNEIVEETGYCRRDYSINNDDFVREKSNFLEKYQNINKNITPHPFPLMYYKKIINLLKKNNIEIFFVLIPEPTDILMSDFMFEKFDIINERSLVFAEKQFPDIKFINYKNIGIDWRVDDFSDFGHLNSKGVKKLGRIIGENKLF